MSQLTLCIVVSLCSTSFEAMTASEAGVAYHEGASGTASVQPQQLGDPTPKRQESRSSSQRENPTSSQACIPEQIGDCIYLIKMKLRCKKGDGPDVVVALVTYRYFDPSPSPPRQTKVRRDRDGLVLCRNLKLKRNGRLKGRVRFRIDFPGQQIRYCVEDKADKRCRCATIEC